jgi:hyaluronoglucosaminidase
MFEPQAHYSVEKKITFKSFKGHADRWEVFPNLHLEEVTVPGTSDGYDILVKENYTVTIRAAHPRGFWYARRYLARQIEQHKALKIGRFKAEPSFEIRGIIEGFYGNPWTYEERLDMLAFCDSYHLNTYMYAPKDDRYHRDLWREPYPPKELSEITSYITHAQSLHLDFYFCISPGKDFVYNSPQDISALNAKVDQVLALGVRHICLLMDDIDYTLAADDQAAFQTPGKAHAYIANSLYSHVRAVVDHAVFVLCPTEYWQNYDTPYRQDIKASLHEDIRVFWTGYNTIAEFIPDEDGVTVQQSFEHPLILWDNYPVNDVTQDMIFLGPLRNRGPKLYQTHEGMVANPMIQWHLSKPALITMADYMWNSHTYHPESSYQQALKELVHHNPTLFLDFKKVADNFRYSIISYDSIDAIELAIENKDVPTVVQYYTELSQAIARLQADHDPLFMAQWQPWLDRLAWDHAWLLDIAAKNDSQIHLKAQQVSQHNHTVGTNFVVKLALRLGLYDGPLYKRHRINFWENTDV